MKVLTINNLPSIVPRKILIPIILFILSFFLYLKALCPSVYWGDCGEFIVASKILGIAHSPGHPLYVLMGRLFSLIPLGDAAFRLNLMSAFFSAATVALLPIIFSGIFGIISALLLMLNLAFWKSALTAEIYPLHHFFLVLLLLIFIKWWHQKYERYLLLFFFILGLSLTNNPTYIFLIPVFFVMILVRKGWAIGTADFKYLIFFILGLTPYFYLLIRSQVEPAIDWGNPDSLSQFFWVTTGREFAEKITKLEYAPETGFFAGFLEYFKNLSNQFAWWILPLFPLGIMRLYQKYKYLFVLTFSVFIINIAYSLAFWGESFALQAYLIPSYMMLCIWAGFAIENILTFVQEKVRVNSVKSIICCLTLILILPIAMNRLKHEDKSGNTTAYHYGRGICQSIGEAPCIFLTENTLDLFLVLYHQQIEGRCENALLIYLPYLGFDWYQEQLLEKNPDLILPDNGDWLQNSVPIFYSPDASFEFSPAHLLPHGLVYKLVDSLPENIPIPDFGDFDFDTIGDGELPSRRRYALMYSRLGNYFYQLKAKENTLKCYQKAQNIFPENPNIYYNLGYFYQEDKNMAAAIENYQRAIELDENLVSGYYNLGVIFLNQKELDRGERYFLSAVHLDEDHLDARYNLATIYFRQKLYEKAIGGYEEIIKIDPSYANAYKDLGLAYLSVGQPQKAVEYLEKYLRLRPNSNHKSTIERIIYENKNQIYSLR